MSKKLYKKCEKCENHSYLTMGGFYLCTNNNCEYKDYEGLNEKGYQGDLNKKEMQTYSV